MTSQDRVPANQIQVDLACADAITETGHQFSGHYWSTRESKTGDSPMPLQKHGQTRNRTGFSRVTVQHTATHCGRTVNSQVCGMLAVPFSGTLMFSKHKLSNHTV
jgi:hypothetical protein